MAARKEVLNEARRLLLAFPNVIGVGIGLRPASLGCSAQVLRVYVKRKLGESDLLPGAVVPRTVLGLPTVVIEAAPGFATAKNVKVYTAGIDIESNVPSVDVRSESGTLGCYALRAGNPVLLTCSHVMFPGFAALPQTGIYQPNYSSCCSGGDKIGTPVYDPKDIKDGKYKGGFKTTLGDVQVPAPNDKGYTVVHNFTCSETDCAIATLDMNPFTRFRNVFSTPEGEIAITGSNTDVLSILPPKAGTAPAPDQYVRVFSPRVNQVIYGTLLWVATSEVTVDSMIIDGKRMTPLFPSGISESPKSDEAAGTMPSINQFLILPRPKPIPGVSDYTKYYAQANITLSFDHGDSGAVVIDSQGRVIAQVVRKLYLKPEQLTLDPAKRKLIEFNSVGSLAVASPIRAVFEQLNITIPATLDISGPTSETPRVMVPGFDGGTERDAQQRAVERLREGLRKTRRGKLILGKVGQHRREVRRLFATVRAISVAWHKLGGAGFYNQAVRSALDPNHIIPNSINGVTRERLINVILPLFVCYGSAELRRDIERYRGWGVEMVLAVATIDDVPKALARRGTTV
ncbi:hypothetical protein BJ917_1527 [Pseudomonas sp. WPR_5_2]|uniref:hypothetical protein n=1 Tax=Pseudomonas sp. WPR_5_2 TaxID=1907371 RepID=UPI000EB395BC|nr:hypothetical protein [Pseudomonas sp. WPR_5_2]RKS28631.1 hypothetical protein BJ917_1527 [Pseudomonas sp. WPR_5_2]